MQEIEEAFSNYLDSRTADKIFDEFYSQIKSAFAAGYVCGGGETINYDKIINIYPKRPKHK